MELESAIKLIREGVEKGEKTQTWADLGAGSGLFSQALATLLPGGSNIYAIDKSFKDGQAIQSPHPSVEIKVVKQDFTIVTGIPHCDGLIMANALHFIGEKLSFLQKLKGMLKVGGRILVIEYDTDASNPWVPWPISCNNLQQLLLNAGWSRPQKLAEQPSLYQAAGMYSLVSIFEK